MHGALRRGRAAGSGHTFTRLLFSKLFSPLQQPPARYWEDPPPPQQQEGKDENKVRKDGEQTERQTPKAKKRKENEDQGDGKQFISGVSEWKCLFVSVMLLTLNV